MRRWLLAFALAGLAGGHAGHAAAQDEVPFITTPDAVTLAMLELAGTTARDHVIDLGSGDGRIVITAARRFGATGLGVEIVPELVLKSRANAERAGVASKVEFRQQDLFATELATDLARASVITMYLLPEVNMQLRPRLLALAPGTRIVSHDWDLGDWLPERTLTLEVPDKAVGRDKRSRVHLWVVPARVQGTWCAATARVEFEQRFAEVSARFHRGAVQSSTEPPLVVFDGRIAALALQGEGTSRSRWRLVGDELRLESAAAALLPYAGQAFRRCP
jgi:SAM-dependent methyltransferase